MIELPKETLELYLKLNRADITEKDGECFFEGEEITTTDEKECLK